MGWDERGVVMEAGGQVRGEVEDGVALETRGEAVLGYSVVWVV